MINMIADGVTFSFGVIFDELQKEFKQSKAITAGVVSLFHAVPLLSGPVASALTDRYIPTKSIQIFLKSLELFFHTRWRTVLNLGPASLADICPAKKINKCQISNFACQSVRKKNLKIFGRSGYFST